LEGTFAENLSIRIGGQKGKPITLRTAPKARAILCGYVEVADSASYVTLSKVTIDGSCSTQNVLQIWGDHFTLQDSEVNGGHTSTIQDCVFLGDPEYGRALDPVIDHNRIHDCGTSGHGHGFYVADALSAVITNNYIYDNAGFGIQLYPRGQQSQIVGNVIDGNGRGSLIFGGEDRSPSSGNIVAYNILSNPAAGYNLMESWGGPVGSANLAKRNCLWPQGRGFANDHEGFEARANVVADPRFYNRSARDFRLRSGSPCRRQRLKGR
jgi:hypothetical protein